MQSLSCADRAIGRSTGGSQISRSAKLWLSFFVLASLALGFFHLTHDHNWGDDFASYLMQTDALLHGNLREFAAQNRFTLEHSSLAIGNGPWGLPILLLPWYAGFGLNLWVLKIPLLLCYAGFLVALFFWARRRLSENQSLLCIALFAFHPFLLRFLDQILADIPFLFVSTLLLYGLEVLEDEEAASSRSLVLLAAAAVFLVSLRTIGSALVLAFLLSGLKYYRRLAIFVGVYLGLSFIYSLCLPSAEHTYLSFLREAGPQGILQNFSGYILLIGNFFESAGPYTWPCFLAVALAFYGLWQGRTKNRIALLYLLFSYLILAVFPFWGGLRYIFALLPILVVGIITILSRYSYKLSLALTILFSAFFLYQSTESALAFRKTDINPDGPLGAETAAAMQFIREKLPEDAAIIFFKPRVVRLFTHRNSLMSTECASMKAGQYLLIHRLMEDPSQITPEALRSCSLHLELKFQSRAYFLFRIH